LKVAGMRHVLRCVLAALAFMHELGMVHADLKTANMLLRGAGAFQDGWRRLLGRAMGVIQGGGAESASGAASTSGAPSASGGVNVNESLGLIYHPPASFEVFPTTMSFEPT
jgi:serine/threonine protein kinase